MAKNTFERVTDSDNVLYGPRKVAFCGFPSQAHPALAKLMELVGLGDVPVVYAGEDQAEDTMAALFQLPPGTGEGHDSGLPRAIIVGGISEKELQQFMGGARASRMQPPLWAVLTPVSETWLLSDLLKELAAERDALSGNGASEP
jgi:hypothetical protein